MTRGGETVSPLNIPAWRDFPLRARLAEHCRLPVRIDNDAKALARAEGWIGAAARQRDYIAMVVSTGVGGGIVVDGRLLEGADGNAGHVGHVIVEPDGAVCGCGARLRRGRGVRAPRSRASPGARPRMPRPMSGAPAGSSVARSRRSRTCSTCSSRSSAARSRSATATRSSPPRRPRSTPAAASTSRAARVVPGALGGDGPLVGAAAVALFTPVRE